MIPLSVIIPTYNRASQLGSTLASLTRQSRTDFQTLIIDHGSTDHTQQVCQQYAEKLSLSYYKIARDNKHFAGVPRDFGARQAETALILFLDAGMIVPSWYIYVHLSFHHLHANAVGIGLQHGYPGMNLSLQEGSPENSVEERTDSLLQHIQIDQTYALLQEQQLLDQRADIDLEHTSIPWFFGWTANLSLAKAAYEAAGGFDLDLEGWGFEDVDLCYRLARHGLRFAFVEDGWGIELPQSRVAFIDRYQSNYTNMLLCYARQRTLVLEALLLTHHFVALRGSEAIKLHNSRMLTPAGQENTPLSLVLDQIQAQFPQYAEEMCARLSALKPDDTAHTLLPAHIRSQLAQPTLLVGGTARDAEYYDYVAVGDEQLTSTSSLWSCWGICIPMPDDSLGTVVVSDVWKNLHWTLQFSSSPSQMLLLETLVSEIKRTAKKAVFLHLSSILSGQVSTDVLEQLCQKHELDFQLLSPVLL